MSPEDIADLLQELLPDVTDGVNEQATTTLIAKALYQRNRRRFWTRPTRQRDLPDSHVTKGWRGVKVYDLGFATASNAEAPEAVLNIKRANGSNPSQEPQLFLADALAAALEMHQRHDFVYAAFLHPGAPTRPGWTSLLPLQGEVEVYLDPVSVLRNSTDDDGSVAADDRALVVGDPPRIVPQSTSDIERIMTGGTNTRLMGAYRRTGTATIHFRVHRRTSTHGTVAVYQPVRVDTTVPDLLEWWP